MILTISHIIISILLIIVIIIQMQGSGISPFGGNNHVYRSKRSFEKLLVRITIILTIGFALTSIALLLPH